MSHKQSQIHWKRKITDQLERTNKIREKIIEETHIGELVSMDGQPKEMDMTERTGRRPAERGRPRQGS